MVAGVMAGLRTTWQAVVMVAAFRLYLLLAAASFTAALLWQSYTPPLLKSEGVSMHLYRYVIGDLDGRSCGSYPVCSSYADQAVLRHGFLIGSWLAMDRLIHEAGDMQSGHWITVNGEKRLYDPVSRNDFWLN